MPRRCIDELTLKPAPEPQLWPSAPQGCSPRQAELWKQLVTSRPVAFWDACSRILLSQLVAHMDSFESCTAEIERERESEEPSDQRVQRLMSLRAQESKSSANLAVRLRLCNSAQMSPERSRRAALDGAAGLREKPWDKAQPKPKREAREPAA